MTAKTERIAAQFFICKIIKRNAADVFFSAVKTKNFPVGAENAVRRIVQFDIPAFIPAAESASAGAGCRLIQNDSALRGFLFGIISTGQAGNTAAQNMNCLHRCPDHFLK